MKTLFSKLKSKAVVIGALAFSSVPAFAEGNITMPTPDYTDLYAAGGVVVGVALVYTLVRHVLSLFKRA